MPRVNVIPFLCGDVTVSVDLDVLRAFSASLTAIFERPARPWNGRALTEHEKYGARDALAAELLASGSQWLAAQAAHEWLSREAW